MSVIMSYYRKVDLNAIQFDFIYYDDSDLDDFKIEIEKLGGRTYKIPTPRLGKQYKQEIDEIFKMITGLYKYKTIHNHLIYMSLFFISLQLNIK